jgi:hypothetical protein
MSGRLTRSFGIDGTDDLVVELNADGQVIFRKEPADRKLRRGEQIPEKRMDIRETMKDLSGKPAKEMEVTAILEALLAKVPIAVFEGDTPKNLAYSMKCWLLKELKQIVNPDTSHHEISD